MSSVYPEFLSFKSSRGRGMKFIRFVAFCYGLYKKPRTIGIRTLYFMYDEIKKQWTVDVRLK